MGRKSNAEKPMKYVLFNKKTYAVVGMARTITGICKVGREIEEAHPNWKLGLGRVEMKMTVIDEDFILPMKDRVKKMKFPGRKEEVRVAD